MDDVFLQGQRVFSCSIMAKEANMYFGKEPDFENIYGSAL